MTMEICGESFKLAADKDRWQYCRTPYRHCFPALGDRSRFVRQAANLWQLKAAMPQRLTHVSSPAPDPIQPIDTLPLPVCGYLRSRRARCCKPYADYGYCAAEDPHCYGFKLGVCIARSGMITPYPLLAARLHVIKHPATLLADRAGGGVPADQGCIDAHDQARRAARHAIIVVPPARTRMQPAYPLRIDTM